MLLVGLIHYPLESQPPPHFDIRSTVLLPCPPLVQNILLCPLEKFFNEVVKYNMFIVSQMYGCKILYVLVWKL